MEKKKSKNNAGADSPNVFDINVTPVVCFPILNTLNIRIRRNTRAIVNPSPVVKKSF